MLAIRTPALAQDEETSPDIELGSSRIGGPGLTERERRVVDAWDEPEEYLTEETLPDLGSKKRIPSLHILAERYFGGQQWQEACRFYQMVLDEAGEEGLDGKEGGRRRAARSFFECAESAFAASRFDEVETFLKKAEGLGLTSGRHAFLRRKVVKEKFRKKLINGDLEGAHRLYEQYQSMGEKDEDERIWFGEQLADQAEAAKRDRDNITFKEIMTKLDTIAPLNTKYRAMKTELSGDAALFKNIALVVGAAVAFVVLLSFLSQWRARARVGAAGRRSKNPYLDDDDL
ncbi:MAG: hypothetical protein AAFU79_00890 [Myxococcota bacterium]